MKFLVDAQLPQRLAFWLREKGFDTIHTLELPKANQSGDIEIMKTADIEQRIVISKDIDFFDDHILFGRPKKLLMVKTGNIKNAELMTLFEKNISHLKRLFDDHFLIEISRKDVVVLR